MGVGDDLPGIGAAVGVVKITVPTGFLSLPPPGLAMPVTATAVSAAVRFNRSPCHPPGNGDSASPRSRPHHVLAYFRNKAMLFDSFEQVTKAASSTCDEPGISVRAAATRWPGAGRRHRQPQPGGPARLDHSAGGVEQLGRKDEVAGVAHGFAARGQIKKPAGLLSP